MKNLLVLLIMLSASSLMAQLIDAEGSYFGLKGGVTYSGIDEIKTTIIRPVFPEETYSTQLQNQWGGTAGLFFYMQFENTFVAIQPEILYSMSGGTFNYNDVNGLHYTMAFNYQYINLVPYFKIYPLSQLSDGLAGVHIGVGPQLGINITSNSIRYTSNSEVIGQDLQIQQNLREVLKGKPAFSIALGLGIEWQNFLLEGRYQLGLSDVIETQANGYNFIENPNRNMAFMITLGYAIPFNQ
ncbi:MAG: PorT family protein [Saprospiraceae bacterium]|nr:PorT family protein [Saprospiraceae bacterium]MCB9321329.1 PorT family protein [Lewinellaceae bacterium]